MNIDEIIENFEFLEDWDDRYKYLIELGNDLAPLTEEEKNPATKVQGCVSQVWLICDAGRTGADVEPEQVLSFRGTSDAHIVRGLIAVTLAIFNGKPAKEILTTDETSFFSQIGLEEHITPQRSNGLRSMVKRIKDHAASMV